MFLIVVFLAMKNFISKLSIEDCERAQRLLSARIKYLHEEELNRILINLINREDDEIFLSTPIIELQLSSRAFKSLYEKKLFTIRDILEHGIDKLHLVRHCGKTTVYEIVKAIEKI